MIAVTCRVCGHEHEPDRGAIVQGDWRTCPPCRAAVRDHAERTMQRDGYAPPAPDHPDHDAQLARWDQRWRKALENGERFLVRVHELEREAPDDAA